MAERIGNQTDFDEILMLADYIYLYPTALDSVLVVHPENFKIDPRTNLVKRYDIWPKTKFATADEVFRVNTSLAFSEESCIDVEQFFRSMETALGLDCRGKSVGFGVCPPSPIAEFFLTEEWIRLCTTYVIGQEQVEEIESHFKREEREFSKRVAGEEVAGTTDIWERKP